MEKYPSGWTTFAAFSCPHCPLQNEESIDWALHHIGKVKPDVTIHLGDGHEADSASRWPSEADWSLEHEFNQHNKLLRRVRKASKASRLVMLPGNHDANLMSLNRINAKLRSLCDYRRREPELVHWEHNREYIYERNRCTFRIGQVTFCHGFQTSAAGVRREAMYLGDHYGLYVHGHLHRPNEGQPRRLLWGDEPTNWHIANAGTLADISRMTYVHRKTHDQWGAGLVVGAAKPVKSPRNNQLWTATTLTK
jgi:predicted phosphodiesterase